MFPKTELEFDAQWTEERMPVNLLIIVLKIQYFDPNF